MQKKTTTIPINRIFQRLVQEHPVATNRVRSPRDGADIVKELISDADREHFVVLSLNNKHEVTSIEIAHNHPSQELAPSPEDITMTQRSVEAGEIIGIDVLDHIIVNNKNEYYSMKSFEDI